MLLLQVIITSSHLGQPKCWNKKYNVIIKSDKYVRKNLKKNFNKTKFLLQTVSLKEIPQQYLILPTRCCIPTASKENFFTTR